MLLYKFMALTPFERVADALLGRRLYCPTPKQLNDPLEGMLGDHAVGAEASRPLDDQLRAGLVNHSKGDRLLISEIRGHPCLRSLVKVREK